MAIALDTTSTGTNGGATTLIVSHTCTGSDLILVVSANYHADTTVTGTYNGVSMTSAGKQQRTAGGTDTELFYILSPATGANDIVLTATVAPTVFRLSAASYTGVKQTGQPDATTSATATAISLTTTLTTVADNCWTVMGSWLQDGLADPAGTGTTTRAQIPTIAGQKSWIGDSNGQITPAGSTSLEVVQGTSDDITTVMISIAPSTTTTTTNAPFFGCAF